jgi:hypothetical protein
LAPLEGHSALLAQHSVPLERHSAPLERHSAPLERHSAPLAQHSAQPEPRYSGPDCSCRAVRAAAAAYRRPLGVAELLE